MSDHNDRKQQLMRAIEDFKSELAVISDFIFNHPEVGYQEFQASQLLADYLRKNGFSVEMGYGGLPTAFRAIYRNGSGGPCIGLLCEYDAVKNLGHGCAHHLQGPSIAGAAVAVKKIIRDFPYSIEVIGTPAEECSDGGKNVMLENGAFRQLDAALMMHGSDVTTTDIKSMALSEFIVTFKGVASHSAIAPEKGRSALEAIMLAFNGISFLRGHVRGDVRIHGIIEEGGQVINAIPERAVARIEVRAYDRPYLDEVIARVMRNFEGAALMTETTYEVKLVGHFHNKIPVLSLNRLLMENAEIAQAKAISPPREKTGSTDFASVMYFVPGSCIRVAFIDKGVTSHSQAWLDHGISAEAHEAMLAGAKILALTVMDLIESEEKLAEVKEEFAREKAKIVQ
jgi:amidohydrolase